MTEFERVFSQTDEEAEMAFYQDDDICAFINEEYMLTVDEENGDLIASRLV